MFRYIDNEYQIQGQDHLSLMTLQNYWINKNGFIINISVQELVYLQYFMTFT